MGMGLRRARSLLFWAKFWQCAFLYPQIGQISLSEFGLLPTLSGFRVAQHRSQSTYARAWLEDKLRVCHEYRLSTRPLMSIDTPATCRTRTLPSESTAGSNWVQAQRLRLRARPGRGAGRCCAGCDGGGMQTTTTKVTLPRDGNLCQF